MGDRHLTIGELAKRTGVATSALRYYEELGLLPAPGRVSGQRRYPESAVGLVGVILLLGDVGFSLRIAKAQTAKEVITHGLACPHDDFTTCPNGASIVAARLAGQPLEEAHPPH